MRRSRWGVSHGHRGPGRVGSGFVGHWFCAGGVELWLRFCSTAVPSFAAVPLAQQRRSASCSLAHLGVVYCPVWSLSGECAYSDRVWDQGFLITDPAPVEGGHGGAPAHLALRSSLRLVTRVNALRFCLSRLGPPPRVVVSGASMPPGYRPCVGSGFAAQVLGGWEPYLRSGSFLPAARFLVQRRDQRPVFLLIPPCCRSRVCCRHPSATQVNVLCSCPS